MINVLLKRSTLVVPLLAAVCGLVLLLADPLSFQALRNGLFDQYQRWYPRPYQSVRVRIVDIDEASLERIGQWPWPRTRLAELVDRLNASGATAIGFDMVFAEQDRTSPQIVSSQWSLADGLRNELERLPDHDQVFAESIGRAPIAIGFTLDRALALKTEDRPAQSQALNQPARPYRYIRVGEVSNRWFPSFDRAITSIPVLERAAKGNGALSFVPDSDGVVRRVPLVLGFADEPVATLSAEMLRVGQGSQNFMLKAADGKDAGLAEIRIGQFSVPTTANGELWVHYSNAVPERYIPAWKILAGEVSKDLLENHWVLVGSSAQGLMDLRFSALGRIIPGVEVHAQAIEQILSGHFLQRPSWATAIEAIAVVIGVILVGLLSLRMKSLTAALASASMLAGVLGGGWVAFRNYGLLLNTVTPAFMLIVTFVLGSLIHHFISEREQRWIKAAFSRYVSPNRVAYLVEHPTAMQLGGHRQECSFVFTDLIGFTSLMEAIDPAEAVTLLNAYLDGMIGIAFRHDGTLDRIVGDAVAIMFSAPVAQPDHRARALACAMAMDDFACRYAAELQAKGGDFGQTRIGIHTGEVIVGNFGGSTMFDYRALGDPVNTAARLESVNKHLGTRICISEETLSGCPEDTVVRPVGRLILKGKTHPLQVYEPLSPSHVVGYAPLEVYLDAYRRMASAGENSPSHGGLPALQTFSRLADDFPNDPLVLFHSRRLRGGQTGDLIVMNDK